MIQVFKQIENKPNPVFNTISKGKMKNIDIFLKESILDKKRKEEEGSRTKEWVQRTNTSKDCNLLMTLFCFICIVHASCSILQKLSDNSIFGEHQLYFHFEK